MKVILCIVVVFISTTLASNQQPIINCDDCTNDDDKEWCTAIVQGVKVNMCMPKAAAKSCSSLVSGIAVSDCNLIDAADRNRTAAAAAGFAVIGNQLPKDCRACVSQPEREWCVVDEFGLKAKFCIPKEYSSTFCVNGKRDTDCKKFDEDDQQQQPAIKRKLAFAQTCDQCLAGPSFLTQSWCVVDQPGFKLRACFRDKTGLKPCKLGKRHKKCTGLSEEFKKEFSNRNLSRPGSLSTFVAVGVLLATIF